MRLMQRHKDGFPVRWVIRPFWPWDHGAFGRQQGVLRFQFSVSLKGVPLQLLHRWLGGRC
jgi:hypothetical protein